MANDNSPKGLRTSITALESEIHKLLKDAPWKHHDHSVSTSGQSDKNRNSALTPSLGTESGATTCSEKLDKRIDNRIPWWVKMWVWKPWKRGLGIAVGFAGIAYAIVTYYQWRDAGNNFKIDQRAWVGVRFEIPREIANTSAIPIDLVNVGKSPILWIKMDAMLNVVDNNIAPVFYPPKNHLFIHWGVLFPTDKKSYLVTPTPNNSDGSRRILTDNEIENLSMGKSYIVLHGLVRYQDPFGTHWTRFCHWRTIQRPLLNPTNPLSSSASACIAYNAVGDGEPPYEKKP